jgi:hypothetical protein
MSSTLQDPKHWRDRADETRAKADTFWRNEEEKQRLLRIAAEYDLIADRASEWVRSQELLNPHVEQ